MNKSSIIYQNFRKNNNLSIIEYVICDIIYHIKKGNSVKFINLKLITGVLIYSEIGIYKSTFFALIEKLCDNGFLKKEKETGFICTTDKWEIVYQKSKKTVINIEERKQVFYDSLKVYVSVYEPQMLRDFYDYWTEPNKSGSKFKQELEKTWDLKRRLKTWSKNDKNFNKISPTAEGDDNLIHTN